MSIANIVGPDQILSPENLRPAEIGLARPAVSPVISSDIAIAGIDTAAQSRTHVRPGEIVRKTLHMLPGLVPFGFALVPHPRVLPFESLDAVFLITFVLTALYIAMKKIVGRPGERNFYSTCISYPVSVLATLYLFPNHPEFACVVVVVLAFGDAAACIGGNLFGGRRLPWNPEKTWSGTISFVAVAAPVATFSYWLEANIWSLAAWGDGGPIRVPLTMAVFCGVTTTVVAAIAESWRTEITDNLRVGVAALASLVAAHYLSAAWFLT